MYVTFTYVKIKGNTSIVDVLKLFDELRVNRSYRLNVLTRRIF